MTQCLNRTGVTRVIPVRREGAMRLYGKYTYCDTCWAQVGIGDTTGHIPIHQTGPGIDPDDA